MKPFLKISKKVLTLNDSEAYIYLRLKLSKADKRKINRAYLATCLGVHNLNYISEILTSLENKGLINRKNYRKDNSTTFDIQLNWDFPTEEHWFKVSFEIARKICQSRIIGFALRYRCLAFDDSLEVRYSKSEIAEKMGISRPTLNKNLQLIEIEQLKPGDLFKEDCSLTDENRDELNKMLAYPKTSKVYKLAKWFIEEKLDEQNNSNDMFICLQAGVLKKKTTNDVIKNLSFNFI